jgi:hypothetical protein
MAPHETMTALVQGPGLPVHDPILEDHPVGELLVVSEESLDGIPHLLLHQIRYGPDPGADLLKVPLQAFFVV